jgi:hypothetical protein
MAFSVPVQPMGAGAGRATHRSYEKVVRQEKGVGDQRRHDRAAGESRSSLMQQRDNFNAAPMAAPSEMTRMDFSTGLSNGCVTRDRHKKTPTGPVLGSSVGIISREPAVRGGWPSPGRIIARTAPGEQPAPPSMLIADTHGWFVRALLSALFAVAFLGERHSAREWLGISLVGAAVVALKR